MIGVGVSGGGDAGLVTAVATEGRGLSPEYWAERLMVKLLHLGQEAPEPLRQQIEAFRDGLHKACLHYMRNMEKSARTTLLNELGLVGKV